MKKLYITYVVLLFGTTILYSQFNCGDNLVDSRDSQSYPTVSIGFQCWMAKNLNYGTYTESISLGVPHSNVSDNGIVEKYCYDNNEANCATNGGLYEWDEIMKYTETEKTQGICPNDWHIPSDAEIKELEMALGMSQTDADNLGQRGTDEGTKLLSGGTSGFDALFYGYRFVYGSFANNNETYFWTSTKDEIDNTKAYFRCLRSTHTKVERGKELQIGGFSVRCVLNDGLSIGEINNTSFYLSSPIPNPANISTRISYKLPINVSSGTIIIYNILGNEIKRINVDSSNQPIELNVGDFDSGTYFYLLEFLNKRSTTRSLIIQK